MLIALQNVLRNAPSLKNDNDNDEELIKTSLTIVIPTYNEESNIKFCLSSLLESINPCQKWNILVVDDCSTDKTIEVVEGIRRKNQVSRNLINIFNAGPRPEDVRWVGKNWPCYQAINQIESSWVLFLDADVEIANKTLRSSLRQAINEGIDLLSLAPRIKCNCLAEWMVQPIIATLLTIGFPIKDSNDPKNPTAFAAGPFMLFRMKSYKDIGGHKDLSGEVVEDLALARRIKKSGYKLKFLLGLDALKISMYDDIKDLWEGWSKNWFIGLDRNIGKSMLASLVVFCTFSVPWLIFFISMMQLVNSISEPIKVYICLFLSIVSIILQFVLRKWCEAKFKFPTKYWYLMGVGGLIITAIGPSSILKTITGIGWTWKGRQL